LADLVHHVRQSLSLSDLALAVNLFSKNVHDESLPCSIQTMSCKLLLNLVECIRAKSEAENGNVSHVPQWYTHTHTHTFNGPFSGTTRVRRYKKGKTNLDLLKQETVSGSGISWAICKSAHRSRQITTPAPHHSFFTGRMPFLPPNKQRQSTEGTVVQQLKTAFIRFVAARSWIDIVASGFCDFIISFWLLHDLSCL